MAEEVHPDGLRRELSALLNKYSCENVSGTPDFVLADVALDALKSFNERTHNRADFRGDRVEFIPNGDWYASDVPAEYMEGDIHSSSLTSGETLLHEIFEAPGHRPSDVNTMINDLIRQLHEQQERYILDIFETDRGLRRRIDDMVFEEGPISWETEIDTFDPEYRCRITQEFRLRWKTPEELATDDAARLNIPLEG